MKFAICNLGCKVNNYEANWYKQQLAFKYEEVAFGEKADIYIINSCTVTNTAGSKSRQMMHRARKLNPEACICVVGCYVQMEYGDNGIFDDMDILIGSNHKGELPQLIDEYLQNHEKIVRVDPVINECPFEEMALHQFDQTRAYLKIQDGCNQFCSYCVIPLARGRERSLDPDKVIAIAQQLVNSGHKELVLTGIHTGRYHYGDTGFTALVKRILSEVDGLERLRISSIEITEVTDELAQLIKEDSRLAKHLHIPLQAGSDSVLKAMRRPYDTARFLDSIREIRAIAGPVSISSDVIVGFPEESEQEFETTCAFVQEVGFSFLHIFPYAAKQHTVAASMKGQIAGPIKHERVGKLTKISDGLYNNFVNKFPNGEGEILVERYLDGWWFGHNSEYVLTKIKSDQDLKNQMVKVRYCGVDTEDTLIGELL